VVSVISVANIEMIPAPIPSSALLPPPLSPSLCQGARPGLLPPHLWCVGWQALFGASLMHGYPVVPECGMEVVFVRYRPLLKYIIYEILYRKDRNGRKASAVGYFAVFAPFAVRY